MTLRWVPGWNGLTEPEAVSYVAAVEAADGEPLEYGVARAINDFVLGCKNDGIWSAIKASCILAGARTLNGALVPLVGAAPTNVGPFVSGDYNRETGLVGDGSTKYLDSNRNNNADPQNSKHVAFFKTFGTGQDDTIGFGENLVGATRINASVVGGWVSLNNQGTTSTDNNFGGSYTYNGLVGSSRGSSSNYVFRTNNTNYILSTNSGTPLNGSIYVFSAGRSVYSDSRLAFYSIGESLDLEKLDTRVTRLMNLITYTQTAGLPDLATMDLDAAAYIGGAYRAGGTLS